MIEIELDAKKVATTLAEFQSHPEMQCQASIAISLKRIADALEMLVSAVIEEMILPVDEESPTDGAPGMAATLRNDGNGE